ncbi:hypothetical protein HC776_00870 [bacterium]|nr:hypothetical protein [bacterium]
MLARYPASDYLSTFLLIEGPVCRADQNLWKIIISSDDIIDGFSTDTEVWVDEQVLRLSLLQPPIGQNYTPKEDYLRLSQVPILDVKQQISFGGGGGGDAQEVWSVQSPCAITTLIDTARIELSNCALLYPITNKSVEITIRRPDGIVDRTFSAHSDSVSAYVRPLILMDGSAFGEEIPEDIEVQTWASKSLFFIRLALKQGFG